MTDLNRIKRALKVLSINYIEEVDKNNNTILHWGLSLCMTNYFNKNGKYIKLS